MVGYEEIIALYSFSGKERQLFPYIDSYMDEIEEWLSTRQFDQAQLIRYMLAGLFLEYRATNHHGDDFNTVVEQWTNLDRRPKTKQKLQTINAHLGKPITSTEEYLQKLGIENANDFSRVQEDSLSQFVLHGRF